MIDYAPEWMRRRKKALVPALLVSGIAAFAALFALPPFELALFENSAAVLAGLASWPLLMLLLNGEPFPSRGSFAQAKVGEASAIGFLVENTPAEAARAYREFWLRSTRELRLGSNVVAPVSILFLGLVAVKLAPGAIISSVFFIIAALSALRPAIAMFTGSLAAAGRARRASRIKVRVGSEGIALGDGDKGLAWSNFARAWQSDRFLTLVMSPYMAIQFPAAQVPPEARNLILREIATTR
jgi:hypothetical protein